MEFCQTDGGHFFHALSGATILRGENVLSTGTLRVWMDGQSGQFIPEGQHKLDECPRQGAILKAAYGSQGMQIANFHRCTVDQSHYHFEIIFEKDRKK